VDGKIHRRYQLNGSQKRKILFVEIATVKELNARGGTHLNLF
jgi:hypothetical protein